MRSGAAFRGLLCVAILFLAGCGILRETGKLPGAAVSAILPGVKPRQPDPAFLQLELQRFADDYLDRCVSALDDYATRSGTPEARRQALQWRVTLGSAVVSIASGPHPTASLVDMLALTTLSSTALEEHRTRAADSASLEPWLRTSRALETNAWKIAEGVLTPQQVNELKESIDGWWTANPESHGAILTRPQEVTTRLRKVNDQSAAPSSVFSFIGIDPTAGLDPAVQEVMRTRLFAERAMFAAQRMPFLLRWQVELLSDQLLTSPQLAAALTNAASLSVSADRLSQAAESTSRTAAELPDRFTEERKAILAALDQQEGQLRALSADVERTLAAGEKMSASLNTTLLTFDALMKRFGVGEPNQRAGQANSTPFNILDYARTAEEVATMAQQLDQLLRDASNTVAAPALDRRIADLKAVATQAQADAKSVLNHGFLLGAGLVLLSFACGLAYRRLSSRP